MSWYFDIYISQKKQTLHPNGYLKMCIKNMIEKYIHLEKL